MITDPNVKARFEEKFEKTAGCWLWTAGTSEGRYGGFSYQYKKLGAHVASYRIYKGPIPEGQLVRHTCDNSLCVNPEHLILGTHDDNMQDCVERGRRPSAEDHPNAKLTNTQVLDIRRALSTGVSLAAIARRYNVTSGLISHIKQGRSYRYVV